MTKSLIWLASLCCILLTWNNSFANSLTVYAEGILISSGCQLSDDDVRKKIDLSELRFSALENLGRSEMFPFQLEIIDCSVVMLNKTIKITLNSQNTETHNGVNYLKTTGESNVLLALTNSRGTELKFNTPIDIGTVTQSGNESINALSFGVYAQKPFNATLSAGSFSSIVTFNLDYQ